MELQNRIIERYKLISEKGAFLTACAFRNGFKGCAQWVKKGEKTPVKHQKSFLEMIETQIAFDERVKEIKVQNYKIISDSNFS